VNVCHIYAGRQSGFRRGRQKWKKNWGVNGKNGVKQQKMGVKRQNGGDNGKNGGY